jgi:hypothetical protein
MYDFNLAGPQRVPEHEEAPTVVDFPRPHQTLQERIGEIALRLFGIPNRDLSTRDQLRFGTNGSIAVEIGGPKIGTYYNHEAKRGGGVAWLLEFEGGIKRGRPQAEWLNREFGDPLPLMKKTIVAIYPYHYEDASLAYEVVRYAPKEFRQRRPDPSKKGGYDWSVRNVRKVLFGLLELLAADPSELVFVVEGEKDALNVRGLGCVATTNVGGSKKWLDSYNETLAGRDVVLLPDNDLAGREHATYVAGQLVRVARSVRIVSLPGLGDKGDVSDWIAAGRYPRPTPCPGGFGATVYGAAGRRHRPRRRHRWSPYRRIGRCHGRGVLEGECRRFSLYDWTGLAGLGRQAVRNRRHAACFQQGSSNRTPICSRKQ